MRIAFVTFEYPAVYHRGEPVSMHRTLQKNLRSWATRLLCSHRGLIILTAPGIPLMLTSRSGMSRYAERFHSKHCSSGLIYRREIKKAEKEQKFDIIHINGFSYWFLPRRLSTAPHVLTVHHLVRDAAENTGLDFSSRIKDLGGENGFFIPQIEKRALESVDKIIAVSNYTKDRILQTHHVPSEMVDVVYNGVDFDDCTLHSGGSR